MSQRYFVDGPLQPGPLDLVGPEAHHLARVSRLAKGDELCLFNGDGCEYPARVMTIGRRSVTLEVHGVRRPERELPFRLELAASVPKGDRGQFLVEKLTELGVRTFIPLTCQRSNTHPRELRPDKLQRYVIEASKQCGRNVLMQIEPLTSWESYCDATGLDAVSILGHPGGGAGDAAQRIKNGKAVRLAVGPEGGFTDLEIEQALAAGWLAIDLGPRMLRVETAAVALAVLAAAWCG